MINRILSLIDDSGMSDSAICKELSIGNGIIGKWRKGLQKPSTDAIIKIAEYFHVSTDYLLLGDEGDTSISPKGNVLTIEDNEWLELIHQLPLKKQYELKGYVKRMLEEEPNSPTTLKQAK